MTDGSVWPEMVRCSFCVLRNLLILLNRGIISTIGGANMARTKYRIELTDAERSLLTRIVCEGKESERTVMRARILLMSEETQPEKVSIKKLAEMLGTTDTTIQTVRTEYVNVGVEAAVYRKQRTSTHYNSKITEDVVRQIKEIAASTPPEGKKKWSSRMICAEAERRGIVDHIVSSTVCKILREKEK